METAHAHQLEDYVDSAAAFARDAVGSLWHAAYDHREAIAGVALLAGTVLVNRAAIAKAAVDLAADILPLGRVAAGQTAGTAAASELSFAHLAETMEARGITPADLSKSITPAQSLGHGADFEAYSIKDLPEYVARKDLFSPATVGDRLTPVNDMFPGRNVGQPVAWTGDLQILKAQPGQALVTPSQLEGYARRWALRRQTRMLADVPQESFDEFAQTMKDLDNHGLYFDAHGGNAVLDRSTMRFGAIDVSPRMYASQVNSQARFESTFLPHIEEVKVEPYYSQLKAKLALAGSRAGLPDI